MSNRTKRNFFEGAQPLAARPPKETPPVQNGTKTAPDVDLKLNRTALFQQMLAANAGEAVILRQTLFKNLIDPKRDIDGECGYPKTIDITIYSDLYDRGDIAARVVDILPTESWKKTPELTTNQAGTETAWEKRFKELETRHHLFARMEEVDIRSGIGRFGIILLGLNDGKTLDQPVDGVPEIWKPEEGKVGTAPTVELLYLRVFDESSVTVSKWNRNEQSPRFGQPEMYSIRFVEEGTSIAYTKEVHWTRVIHVADNRRNSEVMGRPRMELVFNRLYDLKKILGGSGEMFWKAGFPGYGVKIDPALLKDGVPVTVSKEEVKAEMEQYFHQLQRYFLLEGLTVESLEPQVSDPTNHVKIFIIAICIALGVPYRIFMGSEEAQLAGEQDSRAWRDRLAHRIAMHVEPYVVRALIDRLMQVGVMPVTKEYFVNWPDIFTLSDKDRADVMAKIVEAMAKYVAADVAGAGIMAPMEFLTHICDFTQEEAEDILDAAKKYVDENGLDEEADLDEDGNPIDMEGEDEEGAAPGKKPTAKKPAAKGAKK